MRSLIKTIFSRNFISAFVILIFSLLAARYLVFERGYFVMHDDLQMMRQMEMDKCFADGQIPCRWVPDMGFGFGFPLFNYYPPLPYLVGEAVRSLGFSFVETVKVTFALSLILSAFSMFLLSKVFFGRFGGVLSAVFYVWAPYRAVDIYVRGAMNESWAFVFFPLILLFSYKIICCDKSERTRNIILLSLSFSALLLSHNIMVMIFTPFLLVWVILHLWLNGSFTKFFSLIVSGFLALGLAAFFVLPVIFEQKLVHIDTLTQDYYDFRGHFITINQLFKSRFWGYGGSYFGPQDGMSFQIGHLHWILALVLLIIVIARIAFLVIKYSKTHLKDIKRHPVLLSLFLLLMIGWFSSYLTHSKSIFIWEAIYPLKYAQFPWRFLTIVVFAFSFSVGVIPGVIAKFKSQHGFFAKLVASPLQVIEFLLISTILVAFNWNYFKPMNGKLGKIMDKDKFSGLSWQLQQGGGVLDYLPKSAKRPPYASSGGLLDVIEGDVNIDKVEQGTYWVKFTSDVHSESAEVRVNIFNYPNWRFFADGKELKVSIADDEELGRMYLNLGKKDSLIYGQLFNTPIRTVSNTISLVSWILLISYIVIKKSKSLKS